MSSGKKVSKTGKVHYGYKSKCEDCGKQIATASKRCRRCQGRRRTKLNDEKRRLFHFGTD
jgi:uncharacterized OB-fold protein